jgi:predicted flap endonuclease-1-like 5' DNA nuclease
VQTRQKLTEFESTIAFLVGGGLTLVVLVFALAAATSGPNADVSRLNLFLLGGALLLVLGTLVWLFTSRPWLTHDDWSEPLYVGHEHDAHHADHVDDDAEHAEHSDDHAAPVETLAHAGATEASELAAAMNIAPSTAAAVEVIEAATAAAEQVDPHPVYEPETLADNIYAAIEPPAYAEVAEAHVPDVPAETAAVPEAAPEAETPEAQPPAPATKRLDNLTIIEGIGPKISAALVAAGVDTFAKLAAMQPSEIEGIVRAAGVRMVGKAETWAHQAGLAAEGKFDELKAYQESLTAGRSASDA